MEARVLPVANRVAAHEGDVFHFRIDVSTAVLDSMRLRKCSTADGVNGGIVFVFMHQSDLVRAPDEIPGVTCL